jgi:hypothetical protein
VVVYVLGVSVGFCAAGTESKREVELADRFEARWTSIRYSKAVVLNNPAAAQRQARQEVSEGLTLSCEIAIRKPDLILGTCPEVVITELTDARGRRLDVTQPSRRSRHSYEGLRYHERFAQPGKPSRWRTLMRSVLRLPPPPIPGPQRVRELQPARMDIRLDMALLENNGQEIRCIKGHFHALAAESLDHVEVPFEPNDNWVPLTPDLEILVREATCAGSSYRYRIEASPQGSVMRRLCVGDSLPGRFVLAQQLIGADGKPTHYGPGFPHLPAHVGGSGSGGGGNSQITAIRYVIAVNPRECKVPFQLEDIPLPSLAP